MCQRREVKLQLILCLFIWNCKLKVKISFQTLLSHYGVANFCVNSDTDTFWSWWTLAPAIIFGLLINDFHFSNNLFKLTSKTIRNHQKPKGIKLSGTKSLNEFQWVWHKGTIVCHIITYSWLLKLMFRMFSTKHLPHKVNLF